MSITDDDVPAVTVSFGQSAYTVAEGSSSTVTVELSADPERTVVIPIETANQGGADAADYSGVSAERHLQQRRHLQGLHLHRRGRRRERRRTRASG